MAKACGDIRRWFAAQSVAVLIAAVCSLCFLPTAYADDELSESSNVENRNEIAAVVIPADEKAEPSDEGDSSAQVLSDAYEQNGSEIAGDTPSLSNDALNTPEGTDVTDGTVSLDNLDALPNSGSIPDENQTGDAIPYNELIAGGNFAGSQNSAVSHGSPNASSPRDLSAKADIGKADGQSEEERASAVSEKAFDPSAAINDSANLPSNEIAHVSSAASAAQTLPKLEEDLTEPTDKKPAVSTDEVDDGSDFEQHPSPGIGRSATDGTASASKSTTERKSPEETRSSIPASLEKRLDEPEPLQQSSLHVNNVAILASYWNEESEDSAAQTEPMEPSCAAEECAPVVTTPSHQRHIGYSFPGTRDGLPCVPPEFEVSVRLAKSYSQGENSLLLPDENGTNCSLRISSLQGRDDERKPTCRCGCMRCRSPSQSLD